MQAKGNRDSQINPYRMEDGDIYFTYVDKVRFVNRPNGKADLDFRANGLSIFFRGKKGYLRRQT